MYYMYVCIYTSLSLSIYIYIYTPSRRGVTRSRAYNAGVCEISTDPTRRQCRTHPLPPNVNVHGHGQHECNRSVK